MNLREEIYRELRDDPHVKQLRLNVRLDDGEEGEIKIILTGFAGSYYQKQSAQEAARRSLIRINGHISRNLTIINEIEVF